MFASKTTNTDTKPSREKGDTRFRATKRGVTHDSGTSADSSDDAFLAGLCYNDETAAPQDNDRTHANSDEHRKPGIWLAFIHLLLAPHAGWKKIKGAHFDKDEVARSLFYPLLALMAACRFIDKIYYADPPDTGVLLQRAVAAFVAGFAGYFLISLLARTFLPTGAREKIQTTFGHIYIMIALSALAFSAVIAELVPWLGLLLLIPPTYVAYILVKGVKYLRVPNQETTPTAILMTVLCIGVPAGIYYLMYVMMPPA